MPIHFLRHPVTVLLFLTHFKHLSSQTPNKHSFRRFGTFDEYFISRTLNEQPPCRTLCINSTDLRQLSYCLIMSYINILICNSVPGLKTQKLWVFFDTCMDFIPISYKIRQDCVRVVPGGSPRSVAEAKTLGSRRKLKPVSCYSETEKLN